MISLETVHHDEEVDTCEAGLVCLGALVFVECFHDFGLADFICALNLLREAIVCVDAVAFFEDDRAHLGECPLQALGFNLKLCSIDVELELATKAHRAHLSVTFFD